MSQRELKVHSVSRVAENVVELDLRSCDATPLAPFEPGAHIDLHLPNGLRRSYSLCNDPRESWRYVVAVNLDSDSRGGSAWIHSELREGSILRSDAPVSDFPLVDSPHSVLMAGGIGITPILAMIRRLVEQSRSWELHYAARTGKHHAYASTLTELAAGSGAVLHLHADDEVGHVLDFERIVGQAPWHSHFYCCGPSPMLASFELATRHLPPEQVHLERFRGDDQVALGTDGEFTVDLRRTGKQIVVRPGETILSAVRSIGLDPPTSCEEGLCGTCETRVVSGIPEHRDFVLTEAERAARETMMICCSRSLTAEIALDL